MAQLHHRGGSAGGHDGCHGWMGSTLDRLGIGADECGFGQFGQQRRRGCNALDEKTKIALMIDKGGTK